MSTALTACTPRPRRPWYCVSRSMRAWFAASSNGSSPTTIERRPRLHSKRSSMSTSSLHDPCRRVRLAHADTTVLVGHAHEHRLVAGVEIARPPARHQRNRLDVHDTACGHSSLPLFPGTSSIQLDRSSPGASSVASPRSIAPASPSVEGTLAGSTARHSPLAIPRRNHGTAALLPDPQMRVGGVIERDVERNVRRLR